MLPDSPFWQEPERAAWLARLPETVAACARRWSLQLLPPFSGPWFNHAVPAVLPDGSDVVLKVCIPGEEFRTEAAALAAFDGRGAVRLLEVDHDLRALLLERLLPGSPLLDVRDERRSVGIAAALMRSLHGPPPPEHGFPSVSEWVRRMAERAPALIARSDFPASWLDTGLAVWRELAAEPVEELLLHGDLHHMNILSARRDPWLAIDPKGVVGEPACETVPFLLNALPATLTGGEADRILSARVEQFAEELEIHPRRISAWALVQSVLSASWSLEDEGRGWERALDSADLFRRHL